MKNSEDFVSQCGRLCRNTAIIIKCQDFRKARSALSSLDHVFISSGIRSRSCWRLFKRFNTWNSHSYKVLNILKICKEKMLSYMRRDWVQTNCNWSSRVFILKAVTQFCHHDINFFDETGYSNCRYKKLHIKRIYYLLKIELDTLRTDTRYWQNSYNIKKNSRATYRLQMLFQSSSPLRLYSILIFVDIKYCKTVVVLYLVQVTSVV
jgi:histone deacetylase complex regulatory component SIN3